MPKNDYARRLQAQRSARDERLAEWMLQLSLDLMTITLNDELGIGRERLTRVGDAFSALFSEYAELLYSRDEEDYARAKIDDRLRQIMGERFAPWKQRYPGYR